MTRFLVQHNRLLYSLITLNGTQYIGKDLGKIVIKHSNIRHV